MKKVLISTSTFGQYDVTPIDLLRKNGYEIVSNPFGRTLKKEEVSLLISDVNAIVAGTEILDGEVLSEAKHLKIISRLGVGLDNVDLEFANSHSIPVFSTPDGPSLAVAEMTIGLMLDLLRHVSYLDRSIRGGSWEKKMGNLLTGKKVGILGFGRIGKAVARLLSGFACEVFISDLAYKQEDQERLCLSVRNLDELFEDCEIVSIHLPGGRGTQNLIGIDHLKRLGKRGYLLNMARGGIINEKDLFVALQDGLIAGAALDVFEQEPYTGPLCKLQNIIMTPHIGSYAVEARIKMEMEAVNNILNYEN